MEPHEFVPVCPESIFGNSHTITVLQVLGSIPMHAYIFRNLGNGHVAGKGSTHPQVGRCPPSQATHSATPEKGTPQTACAACTAHCCRLPRLHANRREVKLVCCKSFSFSRQRHRPSSFWGKQMVKCELTSILLLIIKTCLWGKISWCRFGHAPMDLFAHHQQVAHNTVYKNSGDNAQGMIPIMIIPSIIILVQSVLIWCKLRSLFGGDCSHAMYTDRMPRLLNARDGWIEIMRKVKRDEPECLWLMYPFVGGETFAQRLARVVLRARKGQQPPDFKPDLQLCIAFGSYISSCY